MCVSETNVYLRMSTSSNKTVPLTVSYQLEPLSKEQGIMYATILLLALYLLIIFEVSRLYSTLHFSCSVHRLTPLVAVSADIL